MVKPINPGSGSSSYDLQHHAGGDGGSAEKAQQKEVRTPAAQSSQPTEPRMPAGARQGRRSSWASLYSLMENYGVQPASGGTSSGAEGSVDDAADRRTGKARALPADDNERGGMPTIVGAYPRYGDRDLSVFLTSDYANIGYGNADSSANEAGPSRRRIDAPDAAAPSQLTGIGFARVPSALLPEGQAEQLLAQVDRHIGAMSRRSSIVKNRMAPTVALVPRKPSSGQYQYAKGLTAPERVLLTARLEECIRGGQPVMPGITRAQAVDMWLSVQHARLRKHTKDHRTKHRKTEAKYYGATALLTVTAGPIGLIPLKKALGAHKDYYTSLKRPEYEDAFNSFMEMLSADIDEASKRKIADALLNRHLGCEGTIAVFDAGRIAEAMDASQPASGPAARRIPTESRDVVLERGRQDAVIKLAESGFRHVPVDAERDRLVTALKRERKEQAVEATLAAPYLGQYMAQILAEAKKIRYMAGEPPLRALDDREKYNGEPNAGAFAAALNRIINPRSIETWFGRNYAFAAERQLSPAVKQHLYQKAAEIVLAIDKDPKLRAHIFKESVGGLATCNNNILEVLARLSNKVKNHLTFERINAEDPSDRISAGQFASAALRDFRVAMLEQYVDTVVRQRKKIQARFEPELALVLKSALKLRLDLPESITPISVSWWAPQKGDIQAAEDWVRAAERDPEQVRAYFEASPEWRDGIITLIERDNPIDAIPLHAFTRPGSFTYLTDDSYMHAPTNTVITNPAIARAIAASDRLNRIYTPPDDEEGYTDLRAGIANAWEQFRDAELDVKKQLTSYVTPYLLPSVSQRDSAIRPTVSPALPSVGGIVPTFTLSDDWIAGLERLEDAGMRAERDLAPRRIAAKLDEIRTLERTKDGLRKTHPDLVKMSDNDIDAALAAQKLRLARRADEEAWAAMELEAKASETGPVKQKLRYIDPDAIEELGTTQHKRIRNVAPVLSDGLVQFNRLQMQIDRLKAQVPGLGIGQLE
jgi:hypothetical protein